MRVYLCGPISGRTDKECKDWRTYCKERLCDTRDPMDRDYRGREDESVAEIVEMDKADIRDCNVVLVNYDRPSVGTSMEVLYSWERGITVIVVAAPLTKISPWLSYHSNVIIHSLDHAIALIGAMG